MNALDIVNMQGMNDIVQDERSDAEADARKQGAWVRSRGTYLTTRGAKGQCAPRPASERPIWKGTKKEIDTLISLVLANYPEVISILIEGGFDCADTFAELNSSGDYIPMASWWEFEIWTRE